MQRTISRFFMLFSLLAALSAGCGKSADKNGGGPPSTNGPPKGGRKDATAEATTAHHPALEVHDALVVDLAANVSPSEAAHRLDAFATSQGGYVEESSASGADGDETSGHVILRVPPAQLEALRGLLASMRKEG